MTKSGRAGYGVKLADGQWWQLVWASREGLAPAWHLSKQEAGMAMEEVDALRPSVNDAATLRAWLSTRSPPEVVDFFVESVSPHPPAGANWTDMNG